MDTRKFDYETIERGLNSKNTVEQRQAYIAKERIGAESRETRRLREALVMAHRSGNRGEIERLHHQMEPEGNRVKDNVERYYRERRGY